MKADEGPSERNQRGWSVERGGVGEEKWLELLSRK